LSAADSGRGVDAEQLADVGPGELLVAGVLDDLGKELLGLGQEAGKSVNRATAWPNQ
jgi:hypothetical protein